MKLLAIDCAASLCAACVFDTLTAEELGRAVVDPGKGHAELLMEVIAQALEAGATSFVDLGKIAVCVGPGSFTGVRVAVSAARGLALALQIPAIGIGTLEALAAETRSCLGSRTVMVAMDAGRDEVHAAVFDPEGGELLGPCALDLPTAIATAVRHHPVLSGTAADIITSKLPAGGYDLGIEAATADILYFARLAAGADVKAKPRPVYLREPDAKPQMSLLSIRSGA